MSIWKKFWKKLKKQEKKNNCEKLQEDKYLHKLKKELKKYK